MFSSHFSLSLLVLIIISLTPNITHANNDINIDVYQNDQTTLLPDSEAEILFNIMDSMSSDQSWRTSYPNPCQPDSSWPGLECKSTQHKNNNNNSNSSTVHVSRLDFGNFPYPTCKQTALFPSLIFSLPYLQSVFFFNCFTLTQTTLTLPNSSSHSSLIQQLSLRSNPALTGQIPPQISHLKSLKILTLSQNRLSGEIPLELFSLTSIVHLDLSYNTLNGTLPQALGGLGGLVGLDLSYNDLSGSIPAAIGELGQLQKLDLSSNRLAGAIPQSVGKLSLLVFMALSNNRLSEPLPRELQSLESLQYFIMDDNPVSAARPLPSELGGLARLQELRLAGSGYSGDIPESFSRLKNLSTLSLQNNRLTGEIPAGLGELSRMYHLNLSRNSLGGIVPFNASFLNRLGRNLDLSGNPGLCLRSSEAYSVKIGVTVCGGGGGGDDQSNGGSLEQPTSEDGSRASPPLIGFSHKLSVVVIYCFWFFCVLHQILFPV